MVVRVASVTPGGEAERLDIAVGDILCEIDGVPTAHCVRDAADVHQVGVHLQRARHTPIVLKYVHPATNRKYSLYTRPGEIRGPADADGVHMVSRKRVGWADNTADQQQPTATAAPTTAPTESPATSPAASPVTLGTPPPLPPEPFAPVAEDRPASRVEVQEAARLVALREKQTAAELRRTYEESQALRDTAGKLTHEVSTLKALCHQLVREEQERERRRKEECIVQCPMC